MFLFSFCHCRFAMETSQNNNNIKKQIFLNFHFAYITLLLLHTSLSKDYVVQYLYLDG